MELREYQKEGVERLFQILTERKSALLADEMGLGKSAQAITLAEHLQVGKLLVVCPASLRLNWEREINKFSARKYAIYIVSSSRDFKKVDWFNIPTAVICSYELADKLPPHLGGGVDMLIADESHYLKTATTKRTKAVLGRLWAMASFRLLMTGTPLPNGVMDGYTIFNKLDPANFSDRYKYGFRYTNAQKNWFTGGWEFKGGRNLGELRTRVSPFMVRRRKTEVLAELPPKVYSDIPLKISGAKDYELPAEYRELVREGELARISTACATARRGLGVCKIPETADYIAEVAAHKDRLVVFAYHRQVVQTLSEILAATTHHTISTISGDTSPGARDAIVQAFQAPGGKQILVAQILSAGIGINLTAADTCIFAELDWVPANMAQAIDRLHRIGTRAESISIHYCLAAGTMDEDIIGTLHQKIKAINEVMNDNGRQYITQ